jgi:hypothetical protein
MEGSKKIVMGTEWFHGPIRLHKWWWFYDLSGTSLLVYWFSSNSYRLWRFCFGYTLNNRDGEVTDNERWTRRWVKFEFLTAGKLNLISLCSLVLGQKWNLINCISRQVTRPLSMGQSEKLKSAKYVRFFLSLEWLWKIWSFCKFNVAIFGIHVPQFRGTCYPCVTEHGYLEYSQTCTWTHGGSSQHSSKQMFSSDIKIINLDSWIQTHTPNDVSCVANADAYSNSWVL